MKNYSAQEGNRNHDVATLFFDVYTELANYCLLKKPEEEFHTWLLRINEEFCCRADFIAGYRAFDASEIETDGVISGTNTCDG